MVLGAKGILQGGLETAQLVPEKIGQLKGAPDAHGAGGEGNTGSRKKTKMIYADYNATMPLEREHLKKVTELILNASANPSSIHSSGRKAKLLLESSRQIIADYLGCDRNQLFFTSGATEANNWAIHNFYTQNPNASFWCSSIEHPSVMEPLSYLKKNHTVDFKLIETDEKGFYKIPEIFSKDQNHFIALMYVNNETGVINPVFSQAQSIKKSTKAFIHMDGVQALGKISIEPLKKSAIDTASFSAHKIGGTSGIGALFVKEPEHFLSQIKGGSQEKNLRAGTENLLGIVSFAQRVFHISENPNWLDHVKEISNYFLESLKNHPKVRLYSHEDCVFNTFCFSIEGVFIEKLLAILDGEKICVSNGSACSSGMIKPSPVLKALGVDDQRARNAIRVSFGPKSHLDHAKKILNIISQWR